MYKCKLHLHTCTYMVLLYMLLFIFVWVVVDCWFFNLCIGTTQTMYIHDMNTVHVDQEGRSMVCV
jgi:membrane-anchored glycerophosphoryl diester phosphodiesterase (GDPDase)